MSNIQYERVKRWLSRIENISDTSYQMDPIESMDFTVSFFQNCWHLKDWLLNDPLVKKDPHLIKAIKDFAEKDSRYIKISQNIANGSKHFMFENWGRQSSGILAKIIGDEQSGTWKSAKYEYSEDDTVYEVVDLAQKCVEEWETFLKENALIS